MNTTPSPVLSVRGLKTWFELDEGTVKAVDMLRKVGVPEPERRINQYPHEMSGGLLQRAMIAMALACQPAVLIADEPTTALDVTTQAQILMLLGELQRESGMAMILIKREST